MNKERKEFYIPSLNDETTKEVVEKKEPIQESQPKDKNNDFFSPFLGRTPNRLADASLNSTSGTKRYEDYRYQNNRDYGISKEKYYNDDRVMTTQEYLDILDDKEPTRVNTPVHKTTWENLNVEEELDAPKFNAPDADFEEEYPLPEEDEQIYEEEIVEEKPAPVAPKTVRRKTTRYSAPPLSLLSTEPFKNTQKNTWADSQSEIINQTFKEFGYGGTVAGYICGPSVTQFLVSVSAGTNVSKIRSFEKDLLLKLSARSIRIQDPIPGKSYAGIEIPNEKRLNVPLGNLINNPKFLQDDRKLLVALGLDITGEEVYADLTKMPHGLIAGTTGSGKSVCINSMIISLIYRNSPEELKMILVDPKMVELSSYDEIPHLAMPVITDPRKASAALNWAVVEMDKRFEVFRISHARNIQSYNEMQVEYGGKIMPYIVIIIDELADLMSVASAEVETAIQRITQKARAAGIHLLVATQRPSTDVIRGTIKNNIPVRAAFKVASYTDSNTIIDHSGAEKLLGLGDMLFADDSGEKRLQGTFVKDSEIVKITNFLRDRYSVSYLIEEGELEEKTIALASNDDQDEIFEQVARYVVEFDTGSNNRIMQEFNISFNRANRLFMKMEALGIVSKTVKGKQREVLVSPSELEEILKEL